MADNAVTLDVREDLKQGREPMGRIMQAVSSLKPGQSLRLLATFEPIPLFRVMEHKGFSHEAWQVAPGNWEVIFTPVTGAHGVTRAWAGRTGVESHLGDWAPPVRSLDNRGLLPPEPMMNILLAVEELKAGDVLEVFNDREPVFLYPELEARGYAVLTEKRPDAVRLLIRRKGMTTR